MSRSQNVARVHQHIEEVLASRMKSPLSFRMRGEAERVASGLSAADELLGDGLSRGAVTEFVGGECSGRTTMALSYVAALTRAGNVCAWVDVADVLDPESVAASAVDLERLLWVRCGADLQKTAPALKVTGDVETMSAIPDSEGKPVRGGGSPHPRSEGRDMPKAIGAMLQAHGGVYDRQGRREKKRIGTPGMPNRPLAFRSEDREEQVASDRQPKNRGGLYAARCAEPLPKQPGVPLKKTRIPVAVECIEPASPGKPWKALDQALRVADLLLQNGGFSVIVLDLGSIPPEVAWRIPLATWFRFRAACERTRASLLLLTQHPCARSSAEWVVRMEAGEMDSSSRVMTAIRYRAEIERQASQREEKLVSIRRPPQSERGRWTSATAWAQGQ